MSPRVSKPFGRGTVYERKDRPGVWIAAVPLGNGQRATETHRSKAAAERAKARLLREREAGQRRPITTYWTVRDLLAEWYAEREPALAPNSRATYQGRIIQDILPALGNVRVVDLDPLQVRRWLAGLRERGRAHKTITLSRGILVSALELACDLEQIPRNPARNQRVPAGAPVKKVEPFTVAETRALLTAADDHRLGVAVWLAVLGLGRAEICGLGWDDYDAEAGLLTVRYQVSRSGDGLRPLKAVARSRSVPVPPLVAAALRRRRSLQAAEKLAAPEWRDSGRVVTKLDGSYLTPDAIYDLVQTLCRRAGVPPRGPHAFRHTASTELAALGVLDRVRADVLGHAQPTMTQVYTHSTEASRRAALEALVDRLTEAK